MTWHLHYTRLYQTMLNWKLKRRTSPYKQIQRLPSQFMPSRETCVVHYDTLSTRVNVPKIYRRCTENCTSSVEDLPGKGVITQQIIHMGNLVNVYHWDISPPSPQSSEPSTPIHPHTSEISIPPHHREEEWEMNDSSVISAPF